MDKKTIMVVDDEPHIVEMMETFLGIKGYEVKGAYSGQSGLVLIQADKPDAVLLDLMMPDIEGYEVCVELRKLPEFATLPILIISARTDPASKRRAEDSGANAYFTKPVNMAELVKKLEALIAERPAAPAEETAAVMPPTPAPPAAMTTQETPSASASTPEAPAAATQPKPPKGLAEAAAPAPPPTAETTPEAPAAETKPKPPAGLAEAAASAPAATPAEAPAESPAAKTEPKRPEGLIPTDPSLS